MRAMKSSKWHENAATDHHHIHEYGEHHMTNLVCTFALALNSIAIQMAEPAVFGYWFCSNFGAMC